MDVVIKALSFFIDLLLPIYIGYSLQKWKKAKQAHFDKMMVINIFFLSTFLNILSFWKITLNSGLIWLPILGILMHIIPGTMAYIYVKSTYNDPLEQGSYILSALLSNRGVIGAISVFILFNEKGYALTQLVVLPTNFILYMFCFPMAQYYYEASRTGRRTNISLRSLLFNPNQIPILGIGLGLLLNIGHFHRFLVFGNIFNYSIHLRSWLYMLPLGYSINFFKMKKYWNIMFGLSAIKFLVTPVVIYLLGRLVIADHQTLTIIVILSCTPTAINAVVTAKIHKLNVDLTMAAFVSTTAVYMFVIFPLIFIIYGKTF